MRKHEKLIQTIAQIFQSSNKYQEVSIKPVFERPPSKMSNGHKYKTNYAQLLSYSQLH